MNCPQPGAGPTTRMVLWLPVISMVSKDNRRSPTTPYGALSSQWAIAQADQRLESSADAAPFLIANARSADALQICRASDSGTMPRVRVQHQGGWLMAAAIPGR